MKKLEKNQGRKSIYLALDRARTPCSLKGYFAISSQIQQHLQMFLVLERAEKGSKKKRPTEQYLINIIRLRNAEENGHLKIKYKFF